MVDPRALPAESPSQSNSSFVLLLSSPSFSVPPSLCLLSPSPLLPVVRDRARRTRRGRLRKNRTCVTTPCRLTLRASENDFERRGMMVITKGQLI